MAVSRHSFIQASLVGQRAPKVVVCVRGVVVDRDRLANQVHSQFMLAHLAGNYTEQVQRIGVVRLVGKNLAIELLCFLQPASLVMLECQINCLLDGQLGHAGQYPILVA